MSRWLLVLVFLSIIACFSSQSFTEQDLRPELERRGWLMQVVQKLPPVRFSYDGQAVDSRRAPADFVQFWLRKGAHVFMYGVLGLFLAAALKGSGLKGSGRWLVTAALLILVASLDEWNQLGVPGRTGRVADVMVDLAGFFFFASAWELFSLRALLDRSGKKKGKKCRILEQGGGSNDGRNRGDRFFPAGARFAAGPGEERGGADHRSRR
ncbi:MAG: VanZ family protein [Peptococcaceae bacterium]|nr:VanZ family protein [Peptococcaceae bacterium]